jgi:hypothetical protein
MPRLIKKGSTDVTDYVYIIDSTTFIEETGITITVLDLQYVRNRSTPSTKVDATALAAVDSGHGDNKMIEIDATDQPGLYRVDWPDAAFATGADKVICTVKGAGFRPVHREYQLVDFDPEDAVRLGLTALPNAAADAAGGLPISDAGGLDMDAMNTNINDIETDTNEIQGKLPTNKFMGSSDGADDDTTLNSILTDTAEIGAAGAGLTDLGGMSTGMKAEVNAEVDSALDTAIPGSPTADSINDVLKTQNDSILKGAAIAGTLSTTEMTTDLTEATDNHFNGSTLKWTSGVLKDQETDITDYTGATKKLTFTAVTEAPSAADTFIIY